MRNAHPLAVSDMEPPFILRGDPPYKVYQYSTAKHYFCFEHRMGPNGNLLWGGPNNDVCGNRLNHAGLHRWNMLSVGDGEVGVKGYYGRKK